MFLRRPFVISPSCDICEKYVQSENVSAKKREKTHETEREREGKRKKIKVREQC